MIRSTSSAFNKRCVTLATILGALCCGASVRAEDPNKTFQVHGFASQAVAHSDANNIGGDSSSGLALDLRELGANFSWRPTPDWLISAQAIMRWSGNTDEGEPRLDYGFVDRAEDFGTHRLGFQLGKVKNPYGFYNTSRDVAHLRPGILLPQSIYFDRVRDFVIAGIGGALYGEHDLRHATLSWQVNGFKPQTDNVELEYLFLGGDSPGHFAGRPSWFAQTILDMDGGKWRLGATLGEVAAKFHSGNLASLESGKHRNQLAILSLSRYSEHWSFTGEYEQIRAKSGGYGATVPILNENNTLESWYIQGTWRFRPAWQTYLRRDVLFLDKNDRGGSDFAARVPGFPAHGRYAKDWTLGIRHDIGRLALFAELHHVDGTAGLSPQDTPRADMAPDWNLLLLQAAYRF